MTGADRRAGPKAAPTTAACPICGRAVQPEVRPFCSRRCADVDLARWLRGAYAIPAAPASGAEEQDAEDAPGPVPSPGQGGRPADDR